MDADKALRLLWFLTALGFGMAILGAVGELLGWWNDVGQALMVLGTLVGVVMGAASVTAGSTNAQVRGVREGVDAARVRLGSMDGKLDAVHGKLDSMDGKLDKLDELDVIEAELNAQTGALDRQIQVLEEIRDTV
jgi:hypothetical protein